MQLSFPPPIMDFFAQIFPCNCKYRDWCLEGFFLFQSTVFGCAFILSPNCRGENRPKRINNLFLETNLLTSQQRMWVRDIKFAAREGRTSLKFAGETFIDLQIFVDIYHKLPGDFCVNKGKKILWQSGKKVAISFSCSTCVPFFGIYDLGIKGNAPTIFKTLFCVNWPVDTPTI